MHFLAALLAQVVIGTAEKVLPGWLHRHCKAWWNFFTPAGRISIGVLVALLVTLICFF